MTSTRQVAANRRNAQSSTGPRTAAGKAVAARNATKHGILTGPLYATQDEDAAELEALQQAIAAELAPEGPLEAALAERVAGALWRLRRVQAAEAGLFDKGATFPHFGDDGPRVTANAARAVNLGRDSLGLLMRYGSALERSLYGALHELQRLQAVRAGARVPAPLAVDVELRGLPEGAA